MRTDSDKLHKAAGKRKDFTCHIDDVLKGCPVMWTKKWDAEMVKVCRVKARSFFVTHFLSPA